jgi:hypothetical protein
MFGNVHLHTARKYFGYSLGLGFVSVLLPLAAVPASPTTELASVTGQVTYEGRPVSGMLICFDVGDTHLHSAYDMLAADGSFCLQTKIAGDGAAPGKYRVHLYPAGGDASLPAKYRDPDTSALQIEVARDWNHFQIELQ